MVRYDGRKGCFRTRKLAFDFDDRIHRDCMNTDPAANSESAAATKPFTAADRLVLLIAEGFGLGRMSVAPGTWGSLWGIPIGYVMLSQGWSVGVFIATAVAMLIPGIPLCDKAARLRNIKDPGSVVWDEMAAFPIVYVVAIGSSVNLWLVLLLGFGFFRLFDIVKPWPVKVFDRIEGGIGIMLDDTVAAIMAAASLWAVLQFVG